MIRFGVFSIFLFVSFARAEGAPRYQVRDAPDFGQILVVTAGGKTFKTFGGEYIEVTKTADFNGDGINDALVSTDTGGNGSATVYYFITVIAGSLVKAEIPFTRFSRASARHDGKRWMVDVSDEDGTRTFAFNGKDAVLIANKIKKRLVSIAEVKGLGEDYSGPETERVLFADVNLDGKKERIRCEIWPRWGTLRCALPLPNGKTQRVPLHSGCDRFGALATISNGRREFVCDVDAIVRFDGRKWLEPQEFAAKSGNAIAGPQAMVMDGAGIHFVTTSGKRIRTLLQGKVLQAAHDTQRDLLWVLREGRLEVFDLRAPKEVATVIALGMPNAVFSITTPGSKYDKRLGSEANMGVTPTTQAEIRIVWKKHLAVDSSTAYGSLGLDEEDEKITAREGKRLARLVRLVGKQWFREHAGRSLRRSASEVTFDEKKRVQLDPRLGSCLGMYGPMEECGQYLPFGASGWRLVRTSYACGDGCYSQCLLYDPKGPPGRRWASPEVPPKWSPASEQISTGSCGAYRFHVGGDWYFDGPRVCSVNGSCTPIEGKVLGWTEPGLELPDEP